MLSHMTKKNIDDIDGIMPFSLYILYETMGEFLINYLLDPHIQLSANKYIFNTF